MPDAICFHYQQSAEKWLKARLCEDGIPFPKSHDLVALLKLLVPTYPLWAVCTAAASNLNAYAVGVRYPGDAATLVEAKQAGRDCQVIRDEVRQSFGM